MNTKLQSASFYLFVVVTLAWKCIQGNGKAEESGLVCGIVFVALMHSKGSGQGDGPESRPIRTSDRLRRRPKIYGRAYLYYTPTIIRTRKGKTKSRTAASRIAQMLAPRPRGPGSKTNNVRANFFFFLLFYELFFFFFLGLYWIEIFAECFM